MANRTWKDAACEVAWNNFNSYPPRGVGRTLQVPEFLAGTFNCHGFVGYFDETSISGEDFPAFSSAFMKWLSENEVKK